MATKLRSSAVAEATQLIARLHGEWCELPVRMRAQGNPELHGAQFMLRAILRGYDGPNSLPDPDYFSRTVTEHEREAGARPSPGPAGSASRTAAYEWDHALAARLAAQLTGKD
jgi:hypothetical protein